MHTHTHTHTHTHLSTFPLQDACGLLGPRVTGEWAGEEGARGRSGGEGSGEGGGLGMADVELVMLVSKRILSDQLRVECLALRTGVRVRYVCVGVCVNMFNMYTYTCVRMY